MTTVGVLGGGQLGRMLALAGYPLGLKLRFFDHSPEAPAGQVGELAVSEFDDLEALDEFARGVDVVTYEFENVPVQAVEHLAKTVRVYPPAEALTNSQDRLSEKRFLRALGIPTASFAPVASAEELQDAVAEIGFPSILKTRRMGYDGKGQCRLSRAEDCGAALAEMQGAPAILEGMVPFEREVSLLTVRSVSGQIEFYPLIENYHEGGILRRSIAPAPGISAGLQQLAQQYGAAIAERLNYAGVLAVEFFQLGEQLLVNEMAPRVHNSGHWTIEGATTSQFENHLRAVLDLPLGITDALGVSAMLNCIGSTPDRRACLAVPGLHFHTYGKSSREGRKVGHLTICAENEVELRKVLPAIERLQSA